MENIAKAKGIDLPVSRKHAIEVCNWIRGKSVAKSKDMLNSVIKKKAAVPFKRFNRDVGHRRGEMASGRYPQKCCGYILKLIESAEANAQNKGLNVEGLYVKSLIPNKGTGVMRYGRRRGIMAKRTHVEVMLEEREKKKTKVAEKKGIKVVEKKETKEVKK